MTVGANEFLSFVLQFYEKYPEMKKNDMHLTGESYGGKYLPLFAWTILEHNYGSTDRMQHIPLVSTMIIDPYTIPEM